MRTLLERLLASGCIVNPPPDVVAALESLIPPPHPTTTQLSALLREPLRDGEFASAVRALIPPLITTVDAAAPLLHTLHLWRSGLTTSTQLAASYDRFRREVAP